MTMPAFEDFQEFMLDTVNILLKYQSIAIEIG